MKALGILMMIFFSASLGIIIADFKKKQLGYIDMLIIIAEKVLILLENTSPDTEKIMKILMEDKRLKNFDFSLENKTILLDEPYKEKVRDYFQSIGKYDTDTQIGISKEFLCDIRNLKEEYQQSYKSRRKLYYAFGLLFGVLFSVIII